MLRTHRQAGVAEGACALAALTWQATCKCGARLDHNSWSSVCHKISLVAIPQNTGSVCCIGSSGGGSCCYPGSRTLSSGGGRSAATASLVHVRHSGGMLKAGLPPCPAKQSPCQLLRPCQLVMQLLRR